MRLLLRFLFSAVALLVASTLLPGIHHGRFLDLLAVAVLLGALNATLGALLNLISNVPVVLTFGCFSLVINGLVFWAAGTLSARLGLGFRVEGCTTAFFGALLTSALTWLLERIFLGPESPRRPEPPRRIKQVN
jgi:putative membrane protein